MRKYSISGKPILTTIWCLSTRNVVLWWWESWSRHRRFIDERKRVTIRGNYKPSLETRRDTSPHLTPGYNHKVRPENWSECRHWSTWAKTRGSINRSHMTTRMFMTIACDCWRGSLVIEVKLKWKQSRLQMFALVVTWRVFRLHTARGPGYSSKRVDVLWWRDYKLLFSSWSPGPHSYWCIVKVTLNCSSIFFTQMKDVVISEKQTIMPLICGPI
jgi:hypothetical protein